MGVSKSMGFPNPSYTIIYTFGDFFKRIQESENGPPIKFETSMQGKILSFWSACLHPRCRQDDPKIRAKQIEILWKESNERKEIVEGIPESEQKRRRYI